MERTCFVYLAFGLVLALATAGPHCSADPIEPEGFVVGLSMGGNETIHIVCVNDQLGGLVVNQILLDGTTTLFDVNVIDPGTQHESVSYTCAFVPIDPNKPDGRSITQTLWATGSFESSMPEICSLCVWTATDAGLLIATPDGPVRLIAKWEQTIF
ncbi:unnamed protein product [Calypogeia fissa]